MSLGILSWTEHLGFLCRVSGADDKKLVSAYTLQNSLAFISRFFSFFFVPVFAYLADLRKINLENNFLIIYFIFLLLMIANLYINTDSYLKRLKKVLNSIYSNENLVISLLKIIPRTFLSSIKNVFTTPFLLLKFLKEIQEIFNTKIIDKDLKVRIILFGITYLPFYACWPLISKLILIYPDRPAFIISLSTFFTLSSTIFQVTYFDPKISTITSFKKIKFIYDKLLLIKINMILILLLIEILCTIIF